LRLNVEARGDRALVDEGVARLSALIERRGGTEP